jgi:sigma-B regulation protein RsbU (phosphoserine phosphatase)
VGIRLKFLLILIIFSVVPLLSFYFINQQLFQKHGNEIIKIATVILLQTTAKELQESADNYSRNLDREFSNLLKHAQRYRDDVAETVLQADLSSQKGTQLLQEQLSEKLVLSFREIQNFRKDLVSLHFFSEAGFSHTYPIDQNTKVESWLLRKDLSPDNPLWLLPEAYHSGTSQSRHVIAALPVLDNYGSRWGIVALEFDIIKVLEATRPSSQWSQYMRILLLEAGPHRDSKTGLPVVIGIRNPLSEKAEWRREMSNLKIDPATQEEITGLFAGMPYGKSGYVSLPYEGEMSVWSYSETGIGLGILNVLPEREALYRIARHPGRLSKWLNLDSLLIVSVVVIIMVIIVAYRSRSMLEPFFLMVSAFKGVSSGDFSTRLKFKTKDERQMVASAFNNMTEELEDGMRMRQGLEVAQEVQHNFFPKTDPDAPDLDIAARISYCEETGGDYIDILDGDDGKICVVVGDVTGHGVGAALLMATVRSLLRARYEVDSDLAGVITSVNSKLAADMGDSGRFVTLFILEIDPASWESSWVRAGHDPAWLFCRNDGSIVSLSGPGVVLGVDGDFVYSEIKKDGLEPGDVILIGTDGIWETTNPEGTMFGKQRLEQLLSETSQQTASEICDSLITAVDHFREAQKQEDDVSVVVIKCREKDSI